MKRHVFAWAAIGIFVGSMAGAESRAGQPQVIDMHVHSTTTSPAELPRLASLNVRYIYLSGLLSDLEQWGQAEPGRYLPALVFPCDGGRAPITGRSCFEAATDLPDLAWLRGEIEAGRIRGFGEMSPQYLGMSPALLYAHPQVYVDMAGLQHEKVIPRAEYEHYRRSLVRAGFARRIMFGSDFPGQLQAGIDAILKADFLTSEQKADILCNNAARFLRLDPHVCDP